MSGENRYSLRDLIEKVSEYMGLDEGLNERRARDYVTRVLQERPGQGARTPYNDEVLYKLLLVLRLRQRAPKLELMDVGRIIRALPSEVVERMGKGEEELELPELSDPDVYARYLLGGESAAGEASDERESFRLEENVLPVESSVARQSSLPLTASRAPDDWTTVPTSKGIRLQIKGEPIHPRFVPTT